MAKDDDETAWETIRATRALIVPAERIRDGRMLLQVLVVLAIALLPLALLPAGPWLFPSRPAAAPAAPVASDVPLADRVRAETGLAPGFVYDLSRAKELAAAEAAEAGAKAIAGDLAVQKAFRLRVHFLSGLAVLAVLSVAILIAQMRLVRQHWEIILENVRTPDAPGLREIRFRQGFGLLVVVFAVLVFGAAATARHMAGNPGLTLTLQSGLGAVVLGLALTTVRGAADLFRTGPWGGWVLPVTLLGLAVLGDTILGTGVAAGAASGIAAVARAEPASVAAGLAALSGLAALAFLGHRRGIGILREQALAPLAAVALVLGGVLAAETLDGLDLPGQGPLRGYLSGLGLPAGPVLAAAAIVGALVVATTAVTLFGNLTFARNYPDADAVEAYALRFRILTRNDPGHRKPAELWKDMRLAISHPPAGTGSDGAPVRLSLTPAQVEALIRALTLTLAVLMVVALVVLSLGLDLLEAGLTLANGAAAPTALRDSFGLSLDATVLLLGLGFSAALSVAYVWPMLRIAPHVAAAGAPTVPEPGPAERLAAALAGGASYDPLTGTLRLVDAGGLVDHEPDDAEKAADAQLAHWIGADKAKFKVICGAWIYGAAFHSILDETLAGKLRQILTLLAPALAGTLLGLIG